MRGDRPMSPRTRTATWFTDIVKESALVGFGRKRMSSPASDADSSVTPPVSISITSDESVAADGGDASASSDVFTFTASTEPCLPCLNEREAKEYMKKWCPLPLTCLLCSSVLPYSRSPVSVGTAVGTCPSTGSASSIILESDSLLKRWAHFWWTFSTIPAYGQV